MKNITIFKLAIVAVIVMLYMGISGILQNESLGPFFTFIGVCTAIGLGIDISGHIRHKIRKNNLRKLGF